MKPHELENIGRILSKHIFSDHPSFYAIWLIYMFASSLILWIVFGDAQTAGIATDEGIKMIGNALWLPAVFTVNSRVAWARTLPERKEQRRLKREFKRDKRIQELERQLELAD